jgi:ribosomal protein S25
VLDMAKKKKGGNEGGGGTVMIYQRVDESLIRRATGAVKRMDVVTQNSLAQELGIRVSLAKAVMRELIKQGVLRVVLSSSKLIIATPTEKK